MAYTTIDKPTDYFNTKLWTGDGNSTQAISGIGHQPDLVWIKNRNLSSGPNLFFDSVRGTNKALVANNNNAEASVSGYLNSFDSDGFTVGNDGAVNGSGDTYCSWNWKAGTSVSGNTGGSGTAKTYTGSVSTDAGFSIIRYIGNGTAGHTIPHHLGTTPAWVIARTISAAKEWDVYHHKNTSSPETDYLVLNTTAATTDASDKWNDTAPTSSVVTLGESSQLNTNDGTCIMYAFAEKKGYSKFGSYTGNGNNDGTFIYTGFRPAWIMTRRTTGSGYYWYIRDTKRSPLNPADQKIAANESSAESSDGNNIIDILSNGFKCRSSLGHTNASGVVYIYMAFAEAPFVSSGGIPTTAR